MTVNSMLTKCTMALNWKMWSSRVSRATVQMDLGGYNVTPGRQQKIWVWLETDSLRDRRPKGKRWGRRGGGRRGGGASRTRARLGSLQGLEETPGRVTVPVLPCPESACRGRCIERAAIESSYRAWHRGSSRSWARALDRASPFP